MTLESIRGAGAGALSIGLVDVLVFSADTVSALFLIVVETAELWIPFLSLLRELPMALPLISDAQLDQLLTVMILVAAALYVVRIGRTASSTLNNQQNE